MGTDAAASLADAEPRVYWLDATDGPPPEPALVEETRADLLVVGGGYTGLWAALQAKEDDPGRDVVLLEADLVGNAASGRNGGFCAASLTHGPANGLERFPEEFDTLEEMGLANLDGIEQALRRHGVDAAFERTGELDIAVQPWQLEDLEAVAGQLRERGEQVELLDAQQVRARVDSPTYLGALWDPRGVALVDPAALARGLRQACLRLGVRLHEHSRVTGLERSGSGVRATTPFGAVTAGRVVLGTNAQTHLLRRLRHYVAPVYDHALVTEPLSPAQRASIGWQGREGLADVANQFHYYRLTGDGRILWGGYDVVYHYGGHVRTEYDQRPETSLRLAEQFFETFPQLAGLRFTHRWGGAIDTCSRFSPFWGTAFGGRLAYVAGYTGLGVGASRFGARVALDLADGVDNERTRLRMVRTKPLPFPPEPVRSAGIQLTRRSIARADQRQGRRDLWLRTLDRFGLGFDS